MLKSLLLFLGAASFLSTAWAIAPDCPANSTGCSLPSCRCFSTEAPQNAAKNITLAIRPQIVYLTFDDAVNAAENYPFYEEALFNRKNPNNAAISATFFITHEYNDYNRTHDLYRHGHDIALHSITHKNDQDYWRALNKTAWMKEFVEQRQLTAKFANIPEAAIKGMRAPFLQIGGDQMYSALAENRFEWECSRPTWQYRPLLWPYTNDYYSGQDCQLGPCPIERYPGFWTVPMVNLLGGNLFPCAMVDTCLPMVNTTAETLNLLKTNFNDHYLGNKAPFGVFTHAAWIVDPGRKAGYIQFLDYLGTLNDVFIVSISKSLDWIKNPVPIARINEIASWNPTPVIANGCPRPVNCRFNGTQTPHAGGAERYMLNCQPCATIRNYPWLNNPLGV